MRKDWELFGEVENGSHGSLDWYCRGGRLPSSEFTGKREGAVVRFGRHKGKVGVYGKCPKCHRIFKLIGVVGGSDG